MSEAEGLDAAMGALPHEHRKWLLRIALDAPEYLERLAEFRSPRAAAVAAGLCEPSTPSITVQLRRLWDRADEQTRQQFFNDILGSDFSATLWRRSPGPRPWVDLERIDASLLAILEAGFTMSELARHLGVDVRTVQRWSKGSKPSSKHAAALANLAERLT